MRLYATDHAPASTQIVKFKNVEDVDSALSGGTVDAGIYDNNIVGDAIKRHPTFEVVAEFDTGEQYGMAVKKDGDVDLLRVVNQVLADIRRAVATTRSTRPGSARRRPRASLPAKIGPSPRATGRSVVASALDEEIPIADGTRPTSSQG